MPHPVADILVVAHRAFLDAKRTKNQHRMVEAAKLIFKVMEHPRSTAFFETLARVSGNAIADAERMGNDPEVLDNEMAPIEPDIDVDEDSEAASPADEGLVDHDEEEDLPQEDEHAGLLRTLSRAGINKAASTRSRNRFRVNASTNAGALTALANLRKYAR